MINKTELFKKIGGILAELNDQYQYIAENPGSLNELELELLSANADFLADHIKILKKLSEAKAEKPAAASEPVVVTEMILTPPPPLNDNFIPKEKSIPEVPFVAEEEKVSEGPAKPAIEEVQVLPDSKPVWEEPVRTAPVPEVKVPEPVKEPIIPEVVVPVRHEPEIKPVPQVQAPVRTLNDIISGQKAQESVAGKYTHQPVKDLKAIISLNDKLLFIKELFNGYSLAYSEAIEILNRFDSFEPADHFLKSNYAEKNNWSSKETTVEKLYEILHRRFSGNV